MSTQMTKEMDKEKYLEILNKLANWRFGEERARLLNPAIQETALSLATIAMCELKIEEEPGFYL
jgi:hypothetical protein